MYEIAWKQRRKGREYTCRIFTNDPFVARAHLNTLQRRRAKVLRCEGLNVRETRHSFFYVPSGLQRLRERIERLYYG